MKITINGMALDCHVAVSHEQKMQGLMFKENPPNMAFLYPQPSVNKFWMKNTPCNLLIIFCYRGKVISIEEGVPYSLKSVGPNRITDLVVEVPYSKYSGAFKVGDIVKII